MVLISNKLFKNSVMTEAVSMLSRIMEIEEGVIADNTLLDLHN